MLQLNEKNVYLYKFFEFLKICFRKMGFVTWNLVHQVVLKRQQLLVV